MTKSPVLIIGGTSDIGQALAREYASHGHDLYLTARKPDQLDSTLSDLKIRHGINAQAFPLDITDFSSYDALLDALPTLPETVICVVGLLGNQKADEKDIIAAAHVFRSNFGGPAHILGLFANKLESLGRGTLIGVSSVAGDRGRASNYIYGAAKAGFTAYLSGLRNRLAKKGVHVLTVKPGFVRTKMIDGINTPAALTSTPDHVAKKIFAAAHAGKDEIYISWHWRIVMTIIKAIPEKIFKKMSI